VRDTTTPASKIIEANVDGPIDQYLARLRQRVKQPCNLALLDYLSSFPERRLQEFPFSTFCTKQRLASMSKLRTHKPDFGRDVPIQTRAKKASRLFPGLLSVKEEKRQFIAFIAENRAHRQYLAITSGRPATPWFDCSAELLEFYRFFGCLAEGGPRGDEGFMPAKYVLDLGSFGDFGRIIMAKPPNHLRPHPVIFRARSGDCAFMAGGSFKWFGWWRGKIKDIANSFPEFLSEYVRYRSRKDALPFDAAGRKRSRQRYLEDISVCRVYAALEDKAMANRVAGRIDLPAPTPRDMRVRVWRFLAVPIP
jgi:hypothetical protein